MIYTAQIQVSSNAETWRAAAPPETIRAASRNETAESIAVQVGADQNITGNTKHWRVVVWAGTGTTIKPSAIVEGRHL